MADLATTLALLTNDDLGAFSRNVAQDNILMQLSPALAGIRFNQSTWSPTTSAIGNFAQAFLSTALGEIGRNQVAEQTKMAASLLPDLFTNPMAVQAPEGIDMDAFEMLKGSSALKKMQRDQAQAQIQQQLANDLFAKGAESALTGLSSGNPRQVAAARDMLAQLGSDPRAKAFGLDKFSGAAMTTPGYDPLADAESPEVANVDSLRKEYNQRIGNFENVLKAAQAISGALKDYGRVSDQELVRYSIQMIEPGMAVREGEQAAIANSQSLPSAWKAALEGALTGKSQLPKEVRDGIQRLATRAYDSQKSVYDKATGYYQGLAESRKLLRPDQSISYLGEAPPAEDIFGPLSPAPDVTGKVSGSLSSGSMQAPAKIDQLTAIRDRLMQGGLSKEEKAQLLEQARQMTVGEQISSVMR